MAKTGVSTTDNLRVQIWEEELYRDGREGSYFNQFMGGSEALVQEKTDLEKKRGDKETFGIRYRLTGAGVTGTQTLEGREEKLSTSDFSVELERYRHGVRDDGDLSRRRPIYDLREESRSALQDWISEKTDRLLFGAALNSPTKILYGGSAANTAALTSSDKMSLELLSKIKTGARTGWARTQVPFRPIKVKGQNYYFYLCSPDVLFDIRQSSAWQQAQREAADRGSDNPLFTGAAGIWDNIVIHSHDLMQDLADVTTYGSGGDLPGSTSLFMGAQALVMAWGQRPNVVERDFDYEEEFGYAVRMTCKAAKPKFTKGSNTFDYAIAAIQTARTQISDL
jgi:N4-gp56 family major capsid protein